MRYLLIVVSLLFAQSVRAANCENESFRGNSYVICKVDVQHEELRLFHKAPDGEVYGHFSAIDLSLGQDQKRLGFAMNAGMYHDDRSPVGHYVEKGVETQRVISNAGPGNFGLLPNGVFCIGSDRAQVIETLAFQDQKLDCAFATQSGPMLVIDGALHPKFLVDATSKHIRNGVGTTKDGKTAVFAISNNTVTFHEFGSLFKDHLNLSSALYFDGRVSRVRAISLGRNDTGFTKLGPIVGVVEPRE